MPASPRGRHRAPRSLRLRGAALVPAVLLAAGGGGVAGLLLPASAAGDQPVRATTAAAAVSLAARLPREVTDPAPARTAQQQQARRFADAQARAAAAKRVSRARRAQQAAAAARVVAAQAEAQRTAAELARRKAAEAARRYVRPTDGALTSRFGPRWGRLHAGVDFGVPVGSPIRSVAAGTVVKTGRDAGGYGIFVHVRHGDGSVTTYNHLSAVVRGSGAVRKGEVIARSGSTGRSTGPHLHFEVRVKNAPVDPLPWLRQHGVAL